MNGADFCTIVYSCYIILYQDSITMTIVVVNKVNYLFRCYGTHG